MAIKTTLERLEQVQAAIEKAEKAISYGDGDISVTRANLATLYKQEERLLAQYNGETGARKGRTRLCLNGGI